MYHNEQIIPTTLDMNTPEQVINNNINGNRQQYINKIQTQHTQNYVRRVQGRDYGRILRDFNTPAQWYRPAPGARSIYFYDPNYQKHLHQQQPNLSVNIRPVPSPMRAVNPSTYRKKHPTIIPSRLQTVPTLPPIITNRKPNDK